MIYWKKKQMSRANSGSTTIACIEKRDLYLWYGLGTSIWLKELVMHTGVLHATKCIN